jgi:TniQ protein
MAAVVLPLLRPLPRRVKPFPRETTESYLRRLAEANRLDATALTSHITGRKGRNGPLPITRLAIVTSLPERTLRWALPELSLEHGQQAKDSSYITSWSITPRDGDRAPMCRFCTLARGITKPVWCWIRSEDVLCLRHARWTYPYWGDQPYLGDQPDILQAHRQHLRLVRRFGRDSVARAYESAAGICKEWQDHRQYDEGFPAAMSLFHGSRLPTIIFDPTIAASAYPQAIALTGLLVSPYWQAQAINGDEPGLERFAREVARRVAPGYRWQQPWRSYDPLCRWILKFKTSGGSGYIRNRAVRS